VGRQDQDAGRGVFLADHPGRVEALGQVVRGHPDVDDGSGLIGLSDRVAAVGGRIEITSPPGDGTSLLVTIPVGAA
jgi:glucose-6-phosphate-specific signal transduction histidine kinase